jgi:hypothetical protein
VKAKKSFVPWHDSIRLSLLVLHLGPRHAELDAGDRVLRDDDRRGSPDPDECEETGAKDGQGAGRAYASVLQLGSEERKGAGQALSIL